MVQSKNCRIKKAMTGASLLVALFLVTGCDSSGFTDLSSSALTGQGGGSGVFAFSDSGTILPTSFTGQVYTVDFATSNGVNPVTFQITSGNPPAGLLLSNTGVLTGKITASPGSYEFSIQATDNAQDVTSKNVTLQVSVPFALTTRGISDAIVGQSYSAVLTASGGLPPYTYNIPTLPTGLTLNTSIGLISGVPTVTGNTTLVVTASDSNGWTDTENILLNVITPVNSVPVIETNSLSNAAVGSAYTAAVIVSGGVYPYHFSISSGTLPPGLTIDAGLGLISGTPTTSGTTPFAVKVQDSLGVQAVQNYSLTVTAPPNPTITTTSLAGATVGTSYAQVITAISGAAPYTFATTSGTLPPGLTIDSGTGIISGIPTSSGTYTFTTTVTDAFNDNGSKSLSLIVAAPPAPVIITSSVSSGVAGTAYAQTISVTLGVSPYVFTIMAGALPTGLTIDSASGTISGTPTTAGSSSFTVLVTDHIGAVANRAYTMTVSSPSNPTITSASLSNGTTGASYIQVLTASGGSSPYTFSIQSGTLPAGLSLDAPSGTISGTPSAAGTSTVSFKVTDSATNNSTRTLSITVVAAALPQITTSSLNNGIVGTTYAQVVSGVNGVPPYTFTVSSGSLPAGLSMNASTGVISGTPTTAGTSNPVFTITDSVSGSSSKSLPIQIIQPTAPVITTASLPNGTVNATYAQAIVVSPGVAPYTFAVASGTLPAGLTLNASSGILSGTPTTAATSTFTLSATDAISAVATQAYTLTVVNPPAPTITNTSLSSGTAGSAYQQVLQTTGGYGALTFSITSGTLQAGLSLDPSSGTISGIPTVAATGSITFKVQDSLGSNSSKSLTIQIVSPPAPVITNSSLAAGTVTVNYAQVVSVTGGVSPYTFSITAGALPAGLSLDPAAGVISGTPTATGSGTFTIKVVDSIAGTSSKSFSIAVSLPSPPVITNTTLAAGQVTVPYAQTVLVQGGISPLTFSVTIGSLPAGLTIGSSTGSISGTPTSAGTSNFTVKVLDSVGNSTTQAYSLVVAASPYATLAFQNTTLLPIMLNTSDTRNILVTGGLPPYSFTITAGAVPAGMTFNSSTGAITGSATATGTSTFTVQVTDSRTSTASQAYNLVVSPILSIPSATFPSAITGQAYSTTVNATGGTAPYVFGAVGLPTGINITSGGAISGATTVAGSYSITVTVTDANGLTAQKTVSMNVASVLSITTATLPISNISKSYTSAVLTSGGLAPLAFTLSTGTLPTGLSLSPTLGTITGTPVPGVNAKTGTFPITVGVTDSSGQSTSQVYSFKVTIGPRVMDDISNKLRTSAVGVPYMDVVRETGGVGTLTYAATGLPTGLTISSVSGYVSGTPSGTAGIYPVSVTITDANGSVGTLVKNIKLVTTGKTAAFENPIVTPIYGRSNEGDLAIGDLNGDGKLDVVTRNANTGEIVVGLNNGDGTFTNYFYTLTGSVAATNVYIADVDGDGKLDVIVLENTSNKVEIIKGDGVWTTGGAGLTRQIISAGLNNPEEIAFADLNSDGKLDMVVSNFTGGNITVFMNCGALTTVTYNGVGTTCNNTSQTMFNYYSGPTTTLANAYGVGLVDMNGDGKFDLVATTWTTKTVNTFLGNGNGTFATTPIAYSGFVSGAQAGLIRATIDMNGDTKPDLLIEGSDGAYVVFGNGAGGFSSYTSAQSNDIATNNFTAAAADINGDGCPDIVTVSNNSTKFSTQIFFNNCAGAFGSRRVINTGYQMLGVGLAKIVSSTRPDLVMLAANWSPRFMVLPNNLTTTAYNSYSATYASTGPFFYASPPAYDGAIYGSPAVGDLNNDGYPDFLIKTQGAATIYLGGPGGTYTPQTTQVGTGEVSATWWFGRQTLLADFNGDGNLDFVSGNYNGNNFGTVAINLGAGDGTFGTQTFFGTDQTGCTTGLGVRSVATGDFNRDGKLDLVVGHACNSVSRISVFFGNGDGTFNTSPTILSGSGAYADSIMVMDVDGDGFQDIVVANDNANLQIFRGKGDGTFYAPNTYSMNVTAGISSLDIADINNDGKLDYVYSPDAGTTWGWLQGGPTGTVTGVANTFSGTATTTTSNFVATRVVDWDDDGKLDVLAFKQNSGTQFFKGNGAGTFTTPAATYESPNIASGSYSTPAIIDLNGDGLPDILNASADTNSCSSVGISFNLSH